MSLFDEIKGGVAAGSADLAEAMDPRAVPTLVNVLSPAGVGYRGIFRPANALEQMHADKEMTLHGFKDRVVQILLIPRQQFAAIPYEWRGKKIQQLAPTAQECTVQSAAYDDTFFFSFVLLSRQPNRTP
jgi:hypothetical protein